MAVALTRHFENLRYLLTLYYKYSLSANATFENKNASNYVEVTGDNRKDNILNILKTA